MIPNALTIAGSDSSGGAGIQADLKTFSALGVYGASVITAVTAQNTRAVTAVHMVPVEIIEAQIDAVFEDLRIDAVKIGMLGDVATIRTVEAGLVRHAGAPIVLDPVMVAKSGDRLLSIESIAALRALTARVTLLTPNLPEVAALLDGDEPRTEQEMAEAGRALRALGAEAVLVKGGHLVDEEEAFDMLVDAQGEFRLSAPRTHTKNTHGTGCSLASALAARLAAKDALRDAAVSAKAFVAEGIAAAEQLHVGKGRGPIHHFHAFWGR